MPVRLNSSRTPPPPPSSSLSSMSWQLPLLCLVFLSLYHESAMLPNKPSDYFISGIDYIDISSSIGSSSSNSSSSSSSSINMTKAKASVTESINASTSTLHNVSTIMATANSTVADPDPPQNSTSTSPSPSISISSRPPPYTLIDDDLVAWRTKRTNVQIFNSWFVNGEGNGNLKDNNTDFQGPILDFAIAGFPKCGTTALMRNLAPVTTMPPSTDICTPVHNTVYYAYMSWPKKFGRRSNINNSSKLKLLKGTKCPRYMETADLIDFGVRLPKTRLIVGIRHPVEWFQSFFNMRMFNYKVKNEDAIDAKLQTLVIRPCHPPNENRREPRQYTKSCDSFGCQGKILNCVARSRFHLPLARMGKTVRDKEEQDLLISEILQTKKRMNDTSITLFPIQLEEKEILNPVFLYESSQPQEEYFWQSLSEFVRINRTDLPEDQGYRMGNGLNTDNKEILKQQNEILFDICEPKYDYVRQELMPIAYTLQKWLRTYFIPASKSRDDVFIPNVDKFEEIVETFQRDPCNRLIRNGTDGEYYVGPNLPSS